MLRIRHAVASYMFVVVAVALAPSVDEVPVRRIEKSHVWEHKQASGSSAKHALSSAAGVRRARVGVSGHAHVKPQVVKEPLVEEKLPTPALVQGSLDAPAVAPAGGTNWKRDVWGVIALSVASGMVVIMVVKIGDLLGWLRSPSGEDPKIRELAVQREAARAIEQALAARPEAATATSPHEENQVRRPSRKERQATQDFDEDPLFTDDELMGSLLAATDEGQKTIADVVQKVKKQTNWAVKRVSLIKHFVDDEQSAIRDRAEDFAVKEATNLLNRLDQALQDDGQSTLSDLYGKVLSLQKQAQEQTDPALSETKTAFNRMTEVFSGKTSVSTDARQGVLDEVRPSPFSILLAGALAPSQLRFMLFSAETSILYNGVMLATAMAVIVLHSRTLCADDLVWVWLYILVGTNTTMVLAAAVNRRWCSSALFIVRSEQANYDDVVVKTGNSILDTFAQVQNGITVFVKAAFLYNAICASSIHIFSKLAFIVHTLNGCFGLIITIWKVLDHELCARSLILFLHVYSLIWLLCALWTGVSLGLWLLSFAARFPAVNQMVLKTSWSLDKDVPFQMPLFQTIARAFLLTDSTAVLAMKKREVNAEVKELQSTVHSIESKINKVRHQRADAAQRRKQAESMESAMIDKYKAKVHAARFSVESGEDRASRATRESHATERSSITTTTTITSGSSYNPTRSTILRDTITSMNTDS